jgi:hypothetical protein
MIRCFTTCMKRINRTTNLGDKIKDTVENFKKEFLSETVQKTKEPQEKSGY